MKKCIALTPEGGGDEEMFDSINSLSSCRVRVFCEVKHIYGSNNGREKGGVEGGEFDLLFSIFKCCI